MRTMPVAIGILFIAPQLANADDATAIVDKAVHAMANSDLRLNRLANVVRTESGTFFLPTGAVPVQRTTYICPPDKIRYEAIYTLNGQSRATVMAVNGLTGWQQSGGKVEDLNNLKAEAIRDRDMDPWGLATLIPLRQQNIKLKVIAPKVVNGKNGVGINVARSERPDAQIYFAADSGLPLKVIVKTRETGVEINHEWDLSEYHDFDGVKLPTKIAVMQNGRKVEEWTVQSCRFPDRLEEKVFQRPK